MGDGEKKAFVLPRAATGFYRPKDGPPPTTDLRTFRTGLHAVARAVGGRVGELEEVSYPRTFHLASIVEHTGESVVLCHAHHPWIAITDVRREWYTDQFLAPPPWADAFTHLGFEVLGPDRLNLPLSDVDTSVLSHDERREVRAYRIDTLGGILFNGWD